MARKRSPRKIDGEHILHHYLQKNLRERDVWLFQMLTARLMAELGIWLDPAIYQRFPILLPFAVRDPSCRKRGKDDTENICASHSGWGPPPLRETRSQAPLETPPVEAPCRPGAPRISLPRSRVFKGLSRQSRRLGWPRRVTSDAPCLAPRGSRL